VISLSFAWDANTEPDLAGYRIFYREEGQEYDYDNPAWQGTSTTATLYQLPDFIDFYFVCRAYDTYGNESEDSNELFYDAFPPMNLEIDYWDVLPTIFLHIDYWKVKLPYMRWNIQRQ